MGEACTEFWWGNLRERDHWEDIGVDGRIILRLAAHRLASQEGLCSMEPLCWKSFSQNNSVFPVNIIPQMLHAHHHLHVSLTRKTNGRTLGNFLKEVILRKSEKIG
jgi:hypothetical protein